MTIDAGATGDEVFIRLKGMTGRELGVTDWFSIDQRDCNLFATLTDDWDVMHNDPEWAKPRFGGTIVQGVHLLSLLPHIMKELEPELPIVSTKSASVLNYGYDRVRIVRPLLVGAPVRDRVRVISVDERNEGDFLVKYLHQFEGRDSEAPHLIAESLSYYVTNYESKWRADN